MAEHDKLLCAPGPPGRAFARRSLPGPASAPLALAWPSIRRQRLLPWAIPAVYVAVRVALRPSTFNAHAIMCPVVAAERRNSLELFHPLYVPLLRLLNAARHALGLAGPSLAWYQALSLAGAAANLRLLHALAERWGLSRRAAFAAAALATASVTSGPGACRRCRTRWRRRRPSLPVLCCSRTGRPGRSAR